MSDNDIFAENPFRALDLKNFPDKKKAAVADDRVLQPERGRGKQRVHAGSAQDNADDATLNPEETELFMQAMSRVRREGKKGKGARMVSAWKSSAPCLTPESAKKSARNAGLLRARPRKRHLLLRRMFEENTPVLWSRKR